MTDEELEMQLREWVQRRNGPRDLQGWQDHYTWLFVDAVDPLLTNGDWWVVTGFPRQQAALAGVDSQGWAQRLEIYGNGLELANGFQELTDPQELRLRYEQESLQRRRQGSSPHPWDEEFAAATAGLPDCAGLAVGLDRLFLALGL